MNAVKQGLSPAIAAGATPRREVGEQRAFALDNLDHAAGGGVVPDGALQLLVDCRLMAGGDWIPGITHVAPAASYKAEAAQRDALLATLEDWDPGR